MRASDFFLIPTELLLHHGTDDIDNELPQFLVFLFFLLVLFSFVSFHFISQMPLFPQRGFAKLAVVEE